MAETKTVKLQVDTNINEVNKGFKKTQKEIDATDESVKDLNKTLNETGKKFAKAQEKTQKSLRGTRKEVDKTDQKLKGVKGGLDGVSAGFETAEGAMSLFGSESENTGVAMDKLRDGMNITDGISSMNKGYKQMKEWGVMTKIAAAGQWLLNAAVGGTTGGLKILRLAMISTGIGALVVGIGLLVANFDKVKRTIKQLFKRFKFLKLAFMPLIATINLVKKGLKLLGIGQGKNAEQAKQRAKWAEEEAKREEQRQKDRMDAIDKLVEAKRKAAQKEIDLAKAKGEATLEAERDLIKQSKVNLENKQKDEQKNFEDSARFTLDYQEKQIKEKKEALAIMATMENLDYHDRVRAMENLSGEKQRILRSNMLSEHSGVTELKQLRSSVQTMEKKHLKFLADETKKHITVTNDMIKNADTDIKIFNANANKEAIANGKKWAKDRLTANRKIQDLETDLMEEGIEKELEQNRIKNERLIEDLTGTAKEKKRLAVLYAEQQAKDVAAIQEKYRKIEEEKTKAFFQSLADFQKEFWEKYDEKRDEANDKRIEKQDAMDALELELMADSLEKQNQLIINSYEDKFAIAEGNAELTKQLNDQMNAEITANNKKYRDQEKIDARNLAIAKADIAVQGLKLVASIAESMAGDDKKRQKAAFNIKKVADIASATMDGYKAVLSTYAGTPGGPVIKGIAAGISGAFAALQIANIAKAKFDDGGDSSDMTSAPGSVGGETSAPSFNIVGDSGINDLEGLGQPAPIQAYVTSQDVTSAQGLDRARIENATI